MEGEQMSSMGSMGKRPHTDTFNQSPKQKGTAEYAIEAVPVSFKLPGSDTIYRVDNSKELTIEDRKEGWIQQPRKRENGREDKYYYHLKSNEMCRSLVEVHDFIKHGISIRSQKKMRKRQEDASQSKKLRGSSLLTKNIVGNYNVQTKMVSVQATPQEVVELQPQEIDNVVRAAKEAEASDGYRSEDQIGQYSFGPANISADPTSAPPDNGDVFPYINFDFLVNL